VIVTFFNHQVHQEQDFQVRGVLGALGGKIWVEKRRVPRVKAK
jgi:hypothetical protein